MSDDQRELFEVTEAKSPTSMRPMLPSNPELTVAAKSAPGR